MDPPLEHIRVLMSLDDRRVPAEIEYPDNPTDITDMIFVDEPVWDYPNKEDQFPYWNMNRFGMSKTLFKEKTIYIAGEHEDYYDPNFFIYNDVIVVDETTQEPHIRIYGYPREVFPPTDFHAAIPILNQDSIWILGSIGYQDCRGIMIQVCRLHVPTMKMELIRTTGDIPPWMDFSENKCDLDTDGVTIRLTAGKQSWAFDTTTCVFTDI